MFNMNIDPSVFQWIILPMLIFCARIVDVSIDTVRIMLLNKGRKLLVFFLGFFQVLVWLMAIRQIFLNLSNVICYIAYAAGFGAGTFVGIHIEDKLAIGNQVIRIITAKDADELTVFLRSKGYGVTSVDGIGSQGKVNILYTVVKRKNISEVTDIIERFNPNAFYTIEDIKFLSKNLPYLRN